MKVLQSSKPGFFRYLEGTRGLAISWLIPCTAGCPDHFRAIAKCQPKVWNILATNWDLWCHLCVLFCYFNMVPNDSFGSFCWLSCPLFRLQQPLLWLLLLLNILFERLAPSPAKCKQYSSSKQSTSLKLPWTNHKKILKKNPHLIVLKTFKNNLSWNLPKIPRENVKIKAF